MTRRNPDLVALQHDLSDVLDDLIDAQERAQTADAVRAIAREIAEVNHRITVAGQLLFKRQTEQITEAVLAIQEERAALDEAIADIEKVGAFIRTVSSFLGLVDQALDLAKLV
ncbi:hypothetical protein [Phenylobacterium kunshanense]|uniref:Uncharacterized protein n=1 Tax=Phenylobacterium kunshanense TaxID=1445034 RepID=A0A328BJN3_9CAUL|nr:hypothetical protein [Phenylobacterium kunshanense]RAK67530.1 hypothetical protein DJ019_06375 [Phenylobacterium kunshanense]